LAADIGVEDADMAAAVAYESAVDSSNFAAVVGSSETASPDQAYVNRATVAVVADAAASVVASLVAAFASSVLRSALKIRALSSCLFGAEESWVEEDAMTWGVGDHTN